MRALVADDDRMTAMIVRRTLEKWDLDVVVAHNGLDAWEMLQSDPSIGLAILDWMMPGLDGPELCRRVRQDPSRAHVYVLLLTAKSGQKDLVAGLDAGADDYLIKPLDNEEFRARVDVGLRVQALRGRLAERVAELEVTTAALKSSMDRYKALVEGTNAAPWEMNASLTFTYVSPQMTRIFGYDADNLLDPALAWSLLHDDDRERVRAQFAALAAAPDGQHFETEYRVRTPGGGMVHVRGIARACQEDGGTVLRGITLDITDQKKLELERRGAQKLESVGRLAAGVAHEINTPVQFVSDSVHFVRDAMRDLATLVEKYRTALQSIVEGRAAVDAVAETTQAEADADLEYVMENVPKALDRSLEGLDRVATIVRSMKEFAHPDQKEMTSVNLNQAIQSTLVIARNEYKYIADVVTDFGELPLVTCHGGDVNQAFLNIIVNASHAIGDRVDGTENKGCISVRTWCDDDAVMISFADTGGGIPDAIQERIFDPFFTTKEVGKGTGQGLAIARSVIFDKHGGELTFESRPGDGTTFFIRLPIDGKRTRIAA